MTAQKGKDLLVKIADGAGFTTVAGLRTRTLVIAGMHDEIVPLGHSRRLYDAAPEGCAECHGRGYKGRIGIFEAIFMDQKIEEILRTKPSEREIALAAKAQGIPTMQEDGVLKVLRGVTSLEELGRVVDLGV